MSTIPHSVPSATDQVEELQNGDRMNQREFHRIYLRMPKDIKAELIGGIVFMASPLKVTHGTRHIDLSVVFGLYRGHTPGVEAGDNVTVILGDEAEPQPDLYMRVLPSHGGQTRTTDADYVEGPPELVCEVAQTSRNIDLHAKRNDYARYGILEYLVWNLAEKKVHWFDLRNGRQIPIDTDGVLRAMTFPGLWIDTSAAFAGNIPGLVAKLNEGLASAEHAEFVERLRAAGPKTT